LAQSVLKGEHAWLETGIIDEMSIPSVVAAPRAVTERLEPAGVA
jgi:hypothetical protein